MTDNPSCPKCGHHNALLLNAKDELECRDCNYKVRTLVYRQQIKTTRDRYEPVITIGTLRGYAAENGEDPDVAIKILKGFGHSVAPWTMLHAAAITADYPGKAEAHEQKRKAYAEAVLIEDGEMVEIEGILYRAKYMRPNCSDPVHFLPV